jgi:type VI secretion system protein ImpH
MRASQRRHPTDVIQRLLDAPWRFDLVQALCVIELWLRRNGHPFGDAMLGHVRFQNSLSMNFPASQIEALTVLGEQQITSSAALQAAFERAELKTITFTPALLGFFGAGGKMPHFYTDDIVDQIHNDRFEGTRAFFDIFYNRIMALYFQAACKHRVQHRFDANGAAAILPMQLALAGTQAAAGDKAVWRETIAARYAGLLRHRPVSASLIESILADYFDLPVRIGQFVGAYDALRPNELCTLGTPRATLGAGATLGARVHERHTRARVCVGPLSIADYNRFLPGAPGAVELKQMLPLFATPAIRFELHLTLRRADVVPVRFAAAYGNRLGHDTCLVSRAARADGLFVFDTHR